MIDLIQRSKDLSVVHFYAEWAEQCEQMNDVLQEMASLPEFKDVKFAKILAENVPQITLEAGVSAVPTVILYKAENIVDRVNGADPGTLTNKIKSRLTEVVPKEALESKLKRLVNQAPCMLFMKGSPANPRFGFFRTIVGILDTYKANYQTFDILQDNEVREGLKKYSNWPTYPQLYIKGELIGGLDIIKEMSESGDLENMLLKKANLEEKIEAAVNKDKIVIAMKGSRGHPKCIYTKQIMDIFENTNVEYETFDVLSDEELRVALNAYVDWPTYPQVYLKGEFLGGFETIKDLYDSNKLMKTLKMGERKRLR